MSNDPIATIKQIVAETFGCDAADVTMDMKPGDIHGWDSLGHIILIEAVQEAFGTDIPVEEALEVENLQALVAIMTR